MNYTINNATARMTYLESLKIARGAGLNPATTRNTMSDLVLEQQLLTSSTNYSFPVTNTQANGTPFNTEVRLNLQDSFVASQWGVFLEKPTSAVDATFIAQTYPNPQVFTTGGVSAAAETIYNSSARITVNNDVLVPVWHLSRHRLVPQTQQTPVIAGVENANPYAQVDLTTDGFHPIEPYLVFIGSKNIQIQVTLVAALAAVETFMRLRLHYRGLLMQNSTTVS